MPSSKPNFARGGFNLLVVTNRVVKDIFPFTCMTTISRSQCLLSVCGKSERLCTPRLSVLSNADLADASNTCKVLSISMASIHSLLYARASVCTERRGKSLLRIDSRTAAAFFRPVPFLITQRLSSAIFLIAFFRSITPTTSFRVRGAVRRDSIRFNCFSSGVASLTFFEYATADFAATTP